MKIKIPKIDKVEFAIIGTFALISFLSIRALRKNIIELKTKQEELLTKLNNE